jgi:NADH-quinone oxidoreductase subunit J
VLIYVGAVMVFMVYVIMLLDVRDPSFTRKYSHLLVPGLVLGVLLAVALAYAAVRAPGTPAESVPAAGAGSSFEVQPFSAAFLRDYWLHFELTSVLLLAAVVAAIAVIKGGRSHDG